MRYTDLYELKMFPFYPWSYKSISLKKFAHNTLTPEKRRRRAPLDTRQTTLSGASPEKSFLLGFLIGLSAPEESLSQACGLESADRSEWSTQKKVRFYPDP